MMLEPTFSMVRPKRSSTDKDGSNESKASTKMKMLSTPMYIEVNAPRDR